MKTFRLSPVLGAACIALLLSAPARAAEPAAFAQAITPFMQALEGRDDAIDPAIEQLTRLSRAEPQDPVLRAYAGAATALRARVVLLPWSKMTAAEDGLALIDKALAQLAPEHDAPRYRGTPGSLETRFVAAGTFLAMPSMFNRQARGQKLLDEVATSPLLEAAPLGFRGAVWLRAGQEAAKAQQPEQARRWLQKVADSGAPQAAAAQARLKAL